MSPGSHDSSLQDQMEFFSDLPSTSQSTVEKQMTEDTNTSSRGMSSSISMTEIPELNTCPEIDDISRRVQELLEEINNSRTSNQEVLDGFQDKLVEKMSEMCQLMKEHMYMVYENNSSKMQARLQELTEVLDSCAKINSELTEATRALGSLRGGLAKSQTSET